MIQITKERTPSKVKIVTAAKMLILWAFILHFCLVTPLYALEQRIQHPGNLDLIYLGKQQTPPGSNLVKAHTKYFIVFENVTAPTIHSIYLLEHTEIEEGDDVLDIGTGSGIQAIFAAEKAKHVIATDIDPIAIKNARYNVERYELQNRVDLRQGDLFAPIKDDEKFDVILFNLLYPFSKGSQHLWEAHDRFFAKVKTYLKPNGRIYYQAGSIDNIPHIQALVKKNGLRIMKMNMATAIKHDREPIVFMIQPYTGSR